MLRHTKAKSNIRSEVIVRADISGKELIKVCKFAKSLNKNKTDFIPGRKVVVSFMNEEYREELQLIN